jgi:hypothetical protein
VASWSAVSSAAISDPSPPPRPASEPPSTPARPSPCWCSTASASVPSRRCLGCPHRGRRPRGRHRRRPADRARSATAIAPSAPTACAAAGDDRPDRAAARGRRRRRLAAGVMGMVGRVAFGPGGPAARGADARPGGRRPRPTARWRCASSPGAPRPPRRGRSGAASRSSPGPATGSPHRSARRGDELAGLRGRPWRARDGRQPRSR